MKCRWGQGGKPRVSSLDQSVNQGKIRIAYPPGGARFIWPPTFTGTPPPVSDILVFISLRGRWQAVA
jgi:hypothetical protein